jgi:hypothetical protein
MTLLSRCNFILTRSCDNLAELLGRQVMEKTSAIILSIAFLLATGSAAMAEDQPSDGRRLAMAIPRPKAQTLVNPGVKASAPTAARSVMVPEPSKEFASHPRVSLPRKPEQVPDDVKAVLIESAQKAEQISRSYNRRIADLIVWVINSMKESRTFTPAAGPHMQQGLPVQLMPATGKQAHSSIFQID